MSGEPDTKKRRIHVGIDQCNEIMQTAEGAAPLTNPDSVQKSSKDVNRGLYPREQRNRSLSMNINGASTSGFVSAASLMTPFKAVDESNLRIKTENEPVNRSPAKNPWQNTQWNRNTTKKKTVLEQTNKLTNYFSVSEKTSSSPKPSGPCVTQPPSTPPKSTRSCNGSTYLYSPIRKAVGSELIYISDDTNSPSSVKSSQSPSKERTYSNDTVRKLFDGQKNLDYNSKIKIGKSIHKKTNPDKQKNERLGSKSGGFCDPELDNSKCSSSVSGFNTRCSSTSTQSIVQKHDKYGLLGTGQAPVSEGKDWFSLLPLDVIENIFSGLPNLDLCLSVNRVCRYWNSIVLNEKFIPWKKKYHKIKAGNGALMDEVQKLMQANGMTHYHNFLPQLIRYMANFKPVTACNMIECLQHHPKYSWVIELFMERLPDLLVNKVPNPWTAITALAILSEAVKDVEQVLQCLSHSSSDCTAIEVQECLYCTASFLLVFKKMKRAAVWNRLHYHVYYALYLHENKSLVTTAQLSSALTSHTGQQSIMRYSNDCSSVRLTHEQMRIVNHRGGPDDVIKIVAFAGTGKTTTLIRYTQMRPSMKFLLVVYNKSVCEAAKRNFPSNVTCKTGHGLAYFPVGLRYKHKFAFNLKVRLIVDILPLREGESLYVRAKFILDTLSTFMSSADPFITTAHTPTTTKDDYNCPVAIDFQKRQLYAEDAQRIWDRMIDPRDLKVPMVHDGYVKLYQLRKPTIDKYDCILIDEAQDLTPAIADILLCQTKPKILVGDPHQQIYAFRGAVNAMQQIQATHIFYLTQSMRFGPEISFVAASCLELYKHVERKTLVGNGKSGHIDGQVKGQLAIITRTNATLFNEAVRECCFTADSGKRVAFVGGTDGFGFPMIRDIYALMLPPEERKKDNMVIKNPFISHFKGIVDLEMYATKTSDVELMGKIKIVKTYNHQLPKFMNQILQRITMNVELADIVLSTAHKAKGLEFSTVRVTDDYNVNYGPSGSSMMAAMFIDDDGELGVVVEEPIRSPSNSAEECNLLYVAVTRAKKCLVMNSTIVSMLKGVGELFEYPVHSSSLQEDGKALKCLARGVDFEPCCLTLSKKKIVVDQQKVLENGVYSPQAVSELISDVAWRHLLGTLPKPKEDST